MARPLSLFLVANLLTQIWASGGRNPLWPLPVSIEVGEDVLWVDRALTATFHCGGSNDTEPHFQVLYPGSLAHHTDQLKQKLLGGYDIVKRRLYRHSASSLESPYERSISEQDIIRRAVRETLLELDRLSFVPWKFHTRHSKFEPDATQQHHKLSYLVMKQTSCPGPATEPKGFHGTEEGYRIVVENSTITVQASSTLGSLRALGESSINQLAQCNLHVRRFGRLMFSFHRVTQTVILLTFLSFWNLHTLCANSNRRLSAVFPPRIKSRYCP